MALWTLDTCGVEPHLACQLEIDGDGKAVRHIRVCPAHAKLGWDHEAVEAENLGKNIAIRNAISAKGIDVNEVGWSIDVDTRDLTLAHPMLSKSDVSAAIDAAREAKPLPEIAVVTVKVA